MRTQSGTQVRPFIADRYAVAVIDVASASPGLVTNYEVKIAGTGALVLPKGNPLASVKFNERGAESFPLLGPVIWRRPFDRIFIDLTLGADLTNVQRQIIIIYQLSGTFDLEIPQLHDFTREEFPNETATVAWGARDSYQIDCQEVTVFLVNNDAGKTLNYRVYSTCQDGTGLWYQDVSSTLLPNTAVVYKVDHACRKVKLSHQNAGAGTLSFAVVFWGRKA